MLGAAFSMNAGSGRRPRRAGQVREACAGAVGCGLWWGSVSSAARPARTGTACPAPRPSQGAPTRGRRRPPARPRRLRRGRSAAPRRSMRAARAHRGAPPRRAPAPEGRRGDAASHGHLVVVHVGCCRWCWWRRWPNCRGGRLNARYPALDFS